jgi:N-glycosylase/DNA lyase
MDPTGSQTVLAVRDYDLDATLASGQAFRWRRTGPAWTGILHGRRVLLESVPGGIQARTAVPVADWGWLTEYLQSGVDLDTVLATFPNDEPMRASVAACRGLRLLRQDPWECLVSFICSSTKQIVQIQQIVELLCARHGEAVPGDFAGPGTAPGTNGRPEPAWAFPKAARLASLDEAALRECKMGFRAPYVLAAARAVDGARLDLAGLARGTCAEAREALMSLPGVGEKIANCVLLFAYGFPEAFPVDVWVMKALRELYFPKRRPNPARLRRFVGTYFGPNAGYAQQYLFHYMRTRRAEP